MGLRPPGRNPAINVRSLQLAGWRARRLTADPSHRCLIPLTDFCEWTPAVHGIGGAKPVEGGMRFAAPEHPVFAVVGFWRPKDAGIGSAMVMCDSNELITTIYPKAMITISTPDDHNRWLTGSNDEVLALQRLYPAAAMTVRGPVFPRLGHR